MTHFAWIWMFVLLPLPLLMRRLLPRAGNGDGQALKVPFFESVSSLSVSRRPSFAVGLKARRILGASVWLLLVCAAARPQWTGEALKVPSEGRNLMLVLDISGSMREGDFELNGRPVTRWDAVRSVADAFVKKREGDRVGVVLFGERAYVYVPLTFDLKTVSTLLNEAEVGMAGTQTAIGDALGLALKATEEVPAQSRVIVLLSDGEANAGTFRPLDAARLAEKAGVKIYTIGAGSDSVAFQGMFGSVKLPRDAEIDERTLKSIAAMTGGEYFRAKDTLQLERIYDKIDALEPVKNDDVFVRPVKELFYYPLALAFGLSVLAALGVAAGRDAA